MDSLGARLAKKNCPKAYTINFYSQSFRTYFQQCQIITRKKLAQRILIMSLKGYFVRAIN